MLSVDDAVPVGLVINELVSNSFKYAFPLGKAGEINISVRTNQDGEIELKVSDNGTGLPEDMIPSQCTTLGMQLVHSLTEIQLQGKLEFQSREGTTVFIRFKPRG